jgi:hypothetical protein
VKEFWLDTAEIIDALRVVPRILLIAFVWFTFSTIGDLVAWYQTLDASNRSVESSGFAFLVVSALLGAASWFSQLYLSTGRKWQ